MGGGSRCKGRGWEEIARYLADRSGWMGRNGEPITKLKQVDVVTAMLLSQITGDFRIRNQMTSSLGDMLG